MGKFITLERCKNFTKYILAWLQRNLSDENKETYTSNLVKLTEDTIAPWVTFEQWLGIHASDLMTTMMMMIKLSIYNPPSQEKLKVSKQQIIYKPIYYQDNTNYRLHFRYRLDEISRFAYQVLNAFKQICAVLIMWSEYSWALNVHHCFMT